MKLKAAYETEVYISQGGYLCIKQVDPMGGDDSLVMLTLEQTKLVIEEMQTLSEDSSWWDPETKTED